MDGAEIYVAGAASALFWNIFSQSFTPSLYRRMAFHPDLTQVVMATQSRICRPAVRRSTWRSVREGTVPKGLKPVSTDAPDVFERNYGKRAPLI